MSTVERHERWVTDVPTMLTNFVPVPNPALVTCQTCWVLVNWDDKEKHAAPIRASKPNAPTYSGGGVRASG